MGHKSDLYVHGPSRVVVAIELKCIELSSSHRLPFLFCCSWVLKPCGLQLSFLDRFRPTSFVLDVLAKESSYHRHDVLTDNFFLPICLFFLLSSNSQWLTERADNVLEVIEMWTRELKDNEKWLNRCLIPLMISVYIQGKEMWVKSRVRTRGCEDVGCQLQTDIEN
jgi:hypothetical protein